MTANIRLKVIVNSVTGIDNSQMDLLDFSYTEVFYYIFAEERPSEEVFEHTENVNCDLIACKTLNTLVKFKFNFA